MKTITLDQYLASLRAQGDFEKSKLCVVCPMCGTVQCGEDLIAAGAGKTFDEVQGFLGFSCVGRWTHNRPPPGDKDKGKQIGCNWTLGGLFQFHDVQIVTPDGELHQSFDVATPEQAIAHVLKLEKPRRNRNTTQSKTVRTRHNGQLEIDHDRGVIWFHTKTGTMLRICRLPKPIPEGLDLDVTPLKLICNWKEPEKGPENGK